MKRNVVNVSIMAPDRWDALDNTGISFLRSKDSRIFQVPLQSPSLSLWHFTILVIKLWSIFIAPGEQVGTLSGRKLVRASSLISASNSPIFNSLSNPGVDYEAEISLSQELQRVGWNDGTLRTHTTLGRWPTSACNSSSRRSDTLFWLP